MWRITVLTVLLSILLHGVATPFVMRRLRFQREGGEGAPAQKAPPLSERTRFAQGPVSRSSGRGRLLPPGRMPMHVADADRALIHARGDAPGQARANFALQEAVIVLATLLARHRFAPVQGKAPRPVMILTLRPEGGVWLRVEPA